MNWWNLGEVVEIEGKAMFAVRSGGTVFPSCRRTSWKGSRNEPLFG